MDLRWNEASGKYNDARTTALYRNYNQQRLETVIGRHAVLMVDYATAHHKGKNDVADAITKKLNALDAMWTNALDNGRPITPETASLDQWSDEDVNVRFRQKLHDKIEAFGKIALSAVRNQTSNESLEENGGIKVYLHLSHRGARDYFKTLRHFEQYVVYLRRLGATTDTDSVEFMEIATAVIWCGLNLGAYIDSIL